MKIEKPAAEVRQHVDLAALVAAVKQAHKAAEQRHGDFLEKCREAGENLRGIKQHLKPSRGEWRQWVVKHMPFSYPSAQRYMQIAKHWQEVEAKKSRMISGDEEKPGPSLSAAMRLIRKPREKIRRRALKLPAWSKELAPAVLKVNREFGIKAKPEATIALLLRLGFNEGQVKKAPQAVRGEMGEKG
ncbi:MAG TPA: DUF3102 domain-containing protein [Gemmataceae bacterium]|nr:DUF3102 domain-containing protein [Gemmataceae bacterium]